MASSSVPEKKFNPHVLRSLIAVVIGTLLLRAASGAMGENIQFYFNAIHQASLNPAHPLRAIVGASRVYAISYTLGGIIIGSFFAAELIGALLFGAWSDRFGRKLFIIFGPLFGAIAVQITALTTVVWMLIVTRLLEGLSTASNAPSTLGFIAETSADSPKLRSRIVGFYEVATIGGTALGFVLGGWLWRHFGTAAIVAGVKLTSPAFALNALIYLASLAVLWIGIHEIRDPGRKAAQPSTTMGETLKHYWEIISTPRVASFAPAWIAINGVLGIWLNLTARILTDRTGRAGQLLVGLFDSQQAGNIIAGYVLFFVLGIMAWSLFFAGMKRITAMLVGIGGLFGSCLLIFAINHQPGLSAPFFIPLCIALAASIMIQSGFTPAALGHLADITENHAGDRGLIMGLYSVFLGLGQFLGTSIAGPFVDRLGADGMVIATTLLGILAAILVLRISRGESGHAEPQENIPHKIEPAAGETH